MTINRLQEFLIVTALIRIPPEEQSLKSGSIFSVPIGGTLGGSNINTKRIRIREKAYFLLFFCFTLDFFAVALCLA